MEKNTKYTHNNKGIAIILTLSLLAFVVVFAEITWTYYVSNNQLHRRYQSDLKTLYDIEAAKAACMWEEKHADNPHTWETTSNLVSKLQGSDINGKFYRLPGFNFRAQAAFVAGTLNIYVHAFRGTETEPRDSQYLEYLNVNSPLYQFTIFSNRDIELPMDGYDALIHCYGGKIHANGDVSLWGGKDNYVRLDQIRELTATGDIYYEEDDRYAPPHEVDYNFDGKVDGMAPAPAVTGSEPWYTTTGELQDLGPYRRYYDGGHGYLGITWKSYGSWLAGDDIGDNPDMWEGEESYFYGGRLIGNPSELRYLKTDGTIAWSTANDNANIHRFYLTDLYGTSLSQQSGTQQFERYGAYFRPYKDAQGNLVDDWFNIPTGLPQSYMWDKYDHTRTPEQPVTFYVTEACTKGSPGCYADPLDPNPTTGTSWRYRKTLSSGVVCNNSTYNTPACNYVKAQNYVAPNGKAYFSNFDVDPYDNDAEFFSDYVYGDDANDPNSPYRQILTFNSGEQPLGFQQYLSGLAQYKVSDVIVPGAERKEMYLGNLFDTSTQDSAYKIKAQEEGLYIDASNVNSVISNLNSGGVQVAKLATFYNWQTSRTTTVLDIDIQKMKEQNKAPANGIVYSKYPLRFSNAENLPGTNSADGKKAVFTVACQESVYLKGDYNTEDWKVSNLATQKMVYTLSDAFNDPGSVPDFAVYLNYPYVYVKLDASDNFIREEGDPDRNNGEWLYGGEGYLPSDLKYWIKAKVEEKQEAHVKQSGYTPPNLVDKASYSYNSLFLTSYPINDRLENWHYVDSRGQWQDAEITITGSVLDLYDGDIPEYENYRVSLGYTEGYFNWYYFDKRGRQAPSSWNLAYRGAYRWYSEPDRTLGYDSRFPETTPNNFEATLGVTGINVWRLITQDYFNSRILQ
jgi:hypothetical protein